MDIVDHGDWIEYEPEHNPFYGIGKVLFCKRVSDDSDWYRYQREELRDNQSVKLTLRKVDDDWRVSTTSTDVSMLFPINHKLIELVDFDGTHETLRGMRFDLDRKEFLPAPQQTADIDPRLLARLKEALKQ